MKQLKTIRRGQIWASKKFSDQTYKRDYETGQNACLIGKHSNDCPFRLTDRKAAWQQGYRDAMYQNDTRTSKMNTESTQNNISNLRKLL
jgi:ribosome modulation factor